MALGERQLSFNIEPAKVRVAGRNRPAEVITGELKLKGELIVEEDLEHGDALAITVATADGRVIAQHYAEVDRPPAFAPIEEKDVGLIGYARVHTGKIGDRVGAP